jgi:glycosyltransferase involved in cell wall biosynthesis
LLSIIIKALNEEEHIARSIQSALRAIELSGIGGEVILADSLSSDNTVAIAQQFPVTVVQLTDPAHRCCGVGPQLGYQVARGDFIYILDGDMELRPEFLPEALLHLEQNPEIAGVAGQIELVGGVGYEFQMRKQQHNVIHSLGLSEWLGCGGLYRRVAIDQVGYFSNRNLHSREEEELGLRLKSAGWKLERINALAVTHYIHNDDSAALLRRRWQSGYIDGAGEIVRALRDSPHFWQVLFGQTKLLLIVSIWTLILLGLALAPLSWLPLLVGLSSLGLVLIYFLVAKGFNYSGLFGFSNQNALALGFLRGLLRKQIDPRAPIPFRTLQDDRSATGA